MTDQEFGSEIKLARERKGWLQKELARRIHRKAPRVCAWERGHDPPGRDDVRMMVREFDDYGFNLVVARYHTSSVLGTRYELVDGGRVGAAVCVEQEMDDVAQAIRAAMSVLLLPAEDASQDVAQELCVELLEAKAAIDEKLRRLTAEHGISALALAGELERRAVSKGYAARKEKTARSQRAA